MAEYLEAPNTPHDFEGAGQTCLQNGKGFSPLVKKNGVSGSLEI